MSAVDSTIMHTRYHALIVLAALLPMLSACGPADLEAVPAEADAVGSTARPQPGEPTLDEVRAAAERFRDINVALEEGYTYGDLPMCVTAEMEARPAHEGAMGIHYFRPDLLGITATSPRVNGTGTHTDFLQPAILIYEPQRDGSIELVAVENLVFVEAWAREGRREPPSFHGIPYDRMEDDPATAADEAHGFEPHYDRHLWLFRPNPNGVYSTMNPDVTCEFADQAPMRHSAHDSGHTQ